MSIAQTLVLCLATPSPLPSGARWRGLRLIADLGRRAQSLPTFRTGGVYASRSDGDRLVTVVACGSKKGVEAAESLLRPEIAAWCEAAGLAQPQLQRFDTGFDHRIGQAPETASLLCVRTVSSGGSWAASDLDRALGFLGSPGAARITGITEPAGARQLVRFGFHTPQDVAAFLRSPDSAAWIGGSHVLEGDWCRGLTLERERNRASAWLRSTPRSQNLSVHIHHSRDGAVVRVQLQGHLDAGGAAKCERLLSRLLTRGHRNILLDLLHLDSATPGALATLARLAREVRSRGGELGLVESEKRFRSLA